MALVHVSNGGGDFLPIVKYDARAGRIFRVDRDANGSTPVDITRSFKAVFDFENVEVGHILFAAGGAPDFRMVKHGAPLPPKPTPDYKTGVRLRVKLSQDCGGDVRELAGTSMAFLTGINKAHDDYDAGRAANPGKLPVMVLTDTMAIESGSGAKRSTNYQPTFKIGGWVPRPADLKAGDAPAAPAPQQQAAEPPPRTEEPAGADDFG
jgi:hypothetical protein